MPLNPNGKVDKPALPFPDTAQAASAGPSTRKANSTEETMRNVWASILPNPPLPIPLDESFFDLGGHSVLATRLIFEIRKVFVVNAPLGMVFDQPTIAGLVKGVDALRNADLGLEYKESNTPPNGYASVPGAGELRNISAPPLEYGQDYINLLSKLRKSYSALPTDLADRPLTVFLTGATGFLGAFVLRDLLSRQRTVKKVFCLVRASDAQKGLDRLKEGSTDRQVWDDEWVKSQRLEVVIGDLSLDLFGLGSNVWAQIAAEADVVVHNGALVRNPSSLTLTLLTLPFRCTGSIPMRNCALRTSYRP